jgi:hypothetical protein
MARPPFVAAVVVTASEQTLCQSRNRPDNAHEDALIE